MAQLRWPAHLVLPEFLFDFLSQRVGQATVGDLKMANALRDKMVQGAKEGRDRQGFSFVLFRGDPWWPRSSMRVLARRPAKLLKGVNFIADAAVLNGKGTAYIVEYHSNKITRVVHSSMVVESASMVGAADRPLFNRKLLGVLWHGDVDCTSHDNPLARMHRSDLGRFVGSGSIVNGPLSPLGACQFAVPDSPLMLRILDAHLLRSCLSIPARCT